MTLYELLFITAVMLSFTVLRFGLPVIFMWMLNRVLALVARPTS